MTGLADADRRAIAKARELAALRDTDAMMTRTGKADPAEAVAYVLGSAQVTLGWLADIAERLDRIRALLAGFDWEHDDGQYALEAIERIVEGDQA